MSELFFKNGKAKKKYCLCLSREKRAEFKRLYGSEIVQCAGCECPYYAVGCGKANLERYAQNKKREG